jgi:hypothetical protein
MSRMGGDAGQDIRKPRLWIDAIHLGRDDQAIRGRSSPSAISPPPRRSGSWLPTPLLTRADEVIE